MAPFRARRSINRTNARAALWRSFSAVVKRYLSDEGVPILTQGTIAFRPDATKLLLVAPAVTFFRGARSATLPRDFAAFRFAAAFFFIAVPFEWED